MKFVALGGGHGLAATLRALKSITPEITAVVGVSDNGGSSGRLREEFSILPPGDLRMALTALCDDNETEWADLLQFRFSGDGPLAGHAVGNLLISALWQSRSNVVAGLDAVCKLLNAHGRVLPLVLTPMDLVAEVVSGTGELLEIEGQVAIATTEHRVNRIKFDYSTVQLCPETLAAISEADVLIMGPGSWFTSVLTHLAVPAVAHAFKSSNATKILILNLVSQSGETEGFSPVQHLEALVQTNPDIEFDFIIAEAALVSNELIRAVADLGAELISETLTDTENVSKHNPAALASAISKSIATIGRKN